MGVSCSADRNIKAKIDAEGLWIEELERNPGRFIPASARRMAALNGPKDRDGRHRRSAPSASALSAPTIAHGGIRRGARGPMTRC